MVHNEIKCGIVMPISEIDGCNENHWNELLSIYKCCITEIGFVPNLVSNAYESGIIQKRIIDNLYSNPIVICDISCRNSNVMFELGIRLAFDKPTIIIKDDKTPFSFDTSIIEHIIYPRDLNYSQIIIFREQLKSKLQATLEESQKNSDYSTFLKHFGHYKITKPREFEISSDAFIIKTLNQINDRINQLIEVQDFNNKKVVGKNKFKNNYVYVDYTDFYSDSELRKINIFEGDTFREFLDNLFYLLPGNIKAFTYEFDWILIDVETGKEIKSNRSINNIPKGKSFQDIRLLSEIGILPNTKLKILKLEE